MKPGSRGLYTHPGGLPLSNGVPRNVSALDADVCIGTPQVSFWTPCCSSKYLPNASMVGFSYIAVTSSGTPLRSLRSSVIVTTRDELKPKSLKGMDGLISAALSPIDFAIRERSQSVTAFALADDTALLPMSAASTSSRCIVESSYQVGRR